jgi:hypothetical protein
MSLYATPWRTRRATDLDLAQLSRFVRPGESQTQLAKAYQAELRRA